MGNKAVALKYDKEQDSAPHEVALGKGEVAQKIIEKAKEYHVPIFCNQELVNSLIHLDVDIQMLPSLYNALVEMFVLLMKNESKV